MACIILAHPLLLLFEYFWTVMALLKPDGALHMQEEFEMLKTNGIIGINCTIFPLELFFYQTCTICSVKKKKNTQKTGVK